MAWGTASGEHFLASNPPLWTTQNIPYAASITPVGSGRSIVLVGTLTGNILVNAPTNPAVGAELCFIFTMGGAGNYATSWDPVFKTNWNAATAVGAISSITLVYDGTNWQAQQPNIVDQNGNVIVGGTLFIGTSQTGQLLTVKKDLTTRFSVDDTGLANVNGTLQFEALGTSNQVQLTGTLGVNGRRLRLTSSGASGSAELELVPGASAAQGTLTSEILMYNQVGANYERFTLSGNQSQWQFDSTYNGVGLPRSMVFQIGGSVGNAINSEPVITIYGDASIDIQGTSYSAQGKTWGVTRARISDATNVGDTRLDIATRTGTPSSNVADDAVITFTRGGSRKWAQGLNFSGTNVDSFDWYSTALMMTLTQAGLLKLIAGQGIDTIAAGTLILGPATATAVQVGRTGQSVGFYGTAPVAKAAAITTPTAPSAGYVQAEAASAKTAIDAIRVALTNIGITA